MRIIHLISSGGWGGREMYPLQLARAQAPRGHAVSLVVKRDTPLAAHLAGSGIEHDALRIGPYLDPRAALALARVLRRRKPEVIQVHLSRDLLLVELACRLAGIRPVRLLHKHIGSAGNKRDPLHRYLYGRLDRVIAVSDYVRQTLLESCPLRPGQITVLHNGVEPERFSGRALEEQERQALRRELGAAPGQLLAGVIGRLDPRKGQELVLRAAARLKASHPQLRFVLVGAPEGDYDRRLIGLARELELEGRVLVTGYRPDAVKAYRSLDILLVPSTREAFGLVAAEGMLAGLPVVASRSGALPEFVREGETGLLVEPEDPASLAAAIAALAGDPELRAALGSRARAWAEAHLSMDRALDRLEALYAECRAGRQAAGSRAAGDGA